MCDLCGRARRTPLYCCTSLPYHKRAVAAPQPREAPRCPAGARTGARSRPRRRAAALGLPVLDAAAARPAGLLFGANKRAADDLLAVGARAPLLGEGQLDDEARAGSVERRLGGVGLVQGDGAAHELNQLPAEPCPPARPPAGNGTFVPRAQPNVFCFVFKEQS